MNCTNRDDFAAEGEDEGPDNPPGEATDQRILLQGAVAESQEDFHCRKEGEPGATSMILKKKSRGGSSGVLPGRSDFSWRDNFRLSWTSAPKRMLRRRIYCGSVMMQPLWRQGGIQILLPSSASSASTPPTYGLGIHCRPKIWLNSNQLKEFLRHFCDECLTLGLPSPILPPSC